MKKITLVGPPFIVESLLHLLSNEPYQFQLLSHEDWRKMEFTRRMDYLRDTNLIHFFWGQRKLVDFIWAKVSGTKVINHYIGTDVLRLFNEKPSKKFKAYLSNLLADRIFCVSPWLQEELTLLDIPAEILPNVFREYPEQISGLPEKPNVYTYIPEGRGEFYGWLIIEKLVQDYPNIQFFVLANKGEEVNHYPNVKFLGWQDDIKQWIQKSYIYLRLTRHDGLPKMVLEALASGRQVIFSGEFPYCHKATTYTELKSCFDRLLKEPKLNLEGAKFVRNVYHPVKTKQALVTLYKELLS